MYGDGLPAKNSAGQLRADDAADEVIRTTEDFEPPFGAGGRVRLSESREGALGLSLFRLSPTLRSPPFARWDTLHYPR